MSDIVLTAIAPHEAGERTVFNTGVSTVGRGGDDYYCGHCGRKMMHNFNIQRLEVDVVFQCGGCEGLNVKPEEQPQ